MPGSALHLVVPSHAVNLAPCVLQMAAAKLVQQTGSASLRFWSKPSHQQPAIVQWIICMCLLADNDLLYLHTFFA
jgi:hypothetical protein